MRFTVPVADLTEALSWVARSLPSRPTSPILAGVKMAVTSNSLNLSTFDYEQAAATDIAVGTDAEAGVAIVSGRTLLDITKALPKSSDVEVYVDGAVLRVHAGKAKFSLPLMPVDEYPSLPPTPPQVGSVAADVFAEAVRQVAIAAGKDTTIPVLTAVKVSFEAETGLLTMVATDRFRLALKTIEYAPAEGAVSLALLVPARSIDTYAKALGGVEDVILGADMSATKGFSVAKAAKTASTRVLDGQFPLYEGLVPTEFVANATIVTRELVEAVKRAALVAEGNASCGLSFTEGTLTVESGQGAATNGAAASSETLSIAYEGEDVQIAFAFQYLLDGLTVIGSEQLTISLVASTRPAVLRPVESGSGDPDFTYLLMPVRQQAR